MSNISELLLEQHELANQLKVLKEREANVRRQICDELLNNKAPGTHKFTFDNIIVKATKKLTYSLDQEMVESMIAEGDLSPAELDAIKTKYELSLTAYKKIEIPGILDDAITVKDAMPTLDVEIL